MALQLHSLFPTAVATVQLQLDPLDLAADLQLLLSLRGEATGNPSEGCAWTGDLNGVWQLHHHPAFAPLVAQVVEVRALGMRAASMGWVVIAVEATRVAAMVGAARAAVT